MASTRQSRNQGRKSKDERPNDEVQAAKEAVRGREKPHNLGDKADSSPAGKEAGGTESHSKGPQVGSVQSVSRDDGMVLSSLPPDSQSAVRQI